MNGAAPARAVSAGLLSTAAVTAIAYLGPIAGLPMIDLAACYASVFSSGPVEGAREWWAGLLIHFGAGAIALPAFFELGVTRLLALSREASGLAFGFLVYLIFGGVLLPLAGQGAFGAGSPDPLLLNFAALAGGVLYGFGLARLGARAQELAPRPRLEEDRRAA